MSRPRTDPTRLAVELVEDVLVVQGPNLDVVLGEVGARLGPDAEVLDARREIVGGIGGFFGRERFTVEARATDLLETLDHDEGPDGASFAAQLARALAEVDEVEPHPEPPLAVVAAGTREADRGVVVVVGAHGDALASAEALAVEHGLDPDEVLILAPERSPERAAWLTVTDVADAARRAERWHHGDRLTVLAMPTHTDPAHARWCREVLAALSPDDVRMASSARPELRAVPA